MNFVYNESLFPFYNFLYNYLLVVGTLMLGGGLAIIIVSSFVYNYDDLENEEKNIELSLYDKTCFYEIKYLKEFRELEERELTKDDLQNLSTKSIEDETPVGKIIMIYNPESESFWYYCDTKTLTYRTLDAAARLFTVKYDCKQICVDYQKEWEASKEAILKLQEENKEEDEDEESSSEEENQFSVFAKFKSYNITGNRAKTENACKDNKMYIHTNKSNRFSYKGRCSEYVDPSKSIKNIDPKANLSFADFKKNECCDT